MTEARVVDLAELSTQELGELVRSGVETLGRRRGKDAFVELLQVGPVVGEALGEAARSLGETGSWAQVGQIAGTTRQAAWSRWRS